ncbi:MAG: alpha-galactosidase [Spirochaetota bacterium]
MKTSHYTIDITGSAEELFCYRARNDGPQLPVSAPSAEIDGRLITFASRNLTEVSVDTTPVPGVVEHRWTGPVDEAPDLSIHLVFRIAEDSPVLRYRFELHAAKPAALTRGERRDRLEYLRLSLPDDVDVTEVTLSEFDPLAHTYRPLERTVSPRERQAGAERMGPILMAHGKAGAIVVAYEHGSQTPDAFLTYAFPDSNRVALRAMKGNYWDGFPLGPEGGFASIWFDLLACNGTSDDAAASFRSFVLEHQSANRDTRAPYVFYNTWNYQERNHAWNARPYLDSMNEERMLAEIDVAHEMGIDVFVIDTGWYEKTGDWAVSRMRFPRGLSPIRERLDRYGMKLGLWFSPTQAAVSSRAVQEYGDCVMTRSGKRPEPRSVWETEESHGMCLVSRYWEAFADELIRCHDEFGVTYFKWDAIGQYGCDDPNHEHGTEANTPEERSEAYAFRQVLYMNKVVDRLCAACPDAIVDFDITEAGRSVGLAFLASGKYFLINNGPYFSSFDFPRHDVRAMVATEGGEATAKELASDLRYDFGMGSNALVYPGPARAQNCRQGVAYDRWIPSILFLTHYLPDDPQHSQAINLASLMLGQNGIWGDLPAVSPAGVQFISETLAAYKRVRDAITRARLIRTGEPGASPEIYEKIDSTTGEGIVCAFSAAPQSVRYVPASARLASAVMTHNATLSHEGNGSPVITFECAKGGAAFVLLARRAFPQAEQP